MLREQTGNMHAVSSHTLELFPGLFLWTDLERFSSMGRVRKHQTGNVVSHAQGGFLSLNMGTVYMLTPLGQANGLMWCKVP